jgi:hypothetical protein
MKIYKNQGEKDEILTANLENVVRGHKSSI